MCVRPGGEVHLRKKGAYRMASPAIVDRLLEGLSQDAAEVVRTAITDRMAGADEAAQQRREKVVDPDVLSTDAYLFQWIDLLSLEDILALVKSGDIKLSALKKLISIWSRLRSIRVRLNQKQ